MGIKSQASVNFLRAFVPSVFSVTQNAGLLDSIVACVGTVKLNYTVILVSMGALSFESILIKEIKHS